MTEAARTGMVWTRGEINHLLARFDNDYSLEDIAKMHERTQAAILSRLVQYDRIIFISRSGMYHKIDPEPWGAGTSPEDPHR